MTELALFDVETPKRKPPKPPPATPRWTANTTRTSCYSCVTQLALGRYITAKRAQWRRELGGQTWFYCYEHAAKHRDEDHLKYREST